jgi:hypothetical protein
VVTDAFRGHTYSVRVLNCEISLVSIQCALYAADLQGFFAGDERPNVLNCALGWRRPASLVSHISDRSRWLPKV